MTEPTEAEVEAAARVLHEREGYDTWPLPACSQCMDAARAALTAAAQVRERAAMPAWDAPHNRHCAAVEELAMKIYAAFEYTGPEQKPAWTPHGNATMQDHARALARRHLLPIYGATEDQGPDVLGIKKGEE